MFTLHVDHSSKQPSERPPGPDSQLSDKGAHLGVHIDGHMSLFCPSRKLFRTFTLAATGSQLGMGCGIQFRAQVAPLTLPTNRSKDTNLNAIRPASTSGKYRGPTPVYPNLKT